MFSWNFTLQAQDGSNTPVIGKVNLLYPGVAKKDVTVNAATTDQLTTMALTAANLKGVILYSNADVTLKTNSSGSPTQTITLKAGIPIVWFEGAGWACPITADVTAFYLTNAGTVQATVNLYFLTNP